MSPILPYLQQFCLKKRHKIADFIVSDLIEPGCGDCIGIGVFTLWAQVIISELVDANEESGVALEFDIFDISLSLVLELSSTVSFNRLNLFSVLITIISVSAWNGFRLSL